MATTATARTTSQEPTSLSNLFNKQSGANFFEKVSEFFHEIGGKIESGADFKDIITSLGDSLKNLFNASAAPATAAPAPIVTAPVVTAPVVAAAPAPSAAPAP